MESEEIVEDKEKVKVTGAKSLSKWTMFFAGIWVAVLTILKSLHILDISEKDIILSGISICSIWTPAYFSIWLDKIKEIRLGNND